MPGLSFISFTSPWILTALLALPLIWWLLRVTPPRPKRIAFPAIGFLLDLKDKEQSAAHTPWWLVLLRMVISALVIIALSGPVLNPAKSITARSALVLVLDDGWPSAPLWERRQIALSAYLTDAEQQNVPVILLTTAPNRSSLDMQEQRLRPASEVKGPAQAIEPKPWLPNRGALIPFLESLKTSLDEQGLAPQVIWLSDGLDHGRADDFSQALSRLGEVTLLQDSKTNLPLTLHPPEASPSGLETRISRPTARAPSTGRVRVIGDKGKLLGHSIFSFKGNDLETYSTVEMPLELRNEARFIEIEKARSAGSVTLIDARWQRQLVGLAVNSGGEPSQPLLSQLYYLERALTPYAEVRKAPLEALLKQNISVLVLADIGQIVGEERKAVADWVERGGLLLRFAGPRLAAAQNDNLLPVVLRQGGRALGGALSWQDPQKLAPFTETSPFFGLTLPDDVTVTRQVLAQPSIDLADHTWASLSDGTPLVTSTPKGLGRIVLFHVTASPDWSNLALSGLYVDMLRRVVQMSSGVLLPTITEVTGNETASNAETEDGAERTENINLRPLKALNGYGQLESPGPTSLPLPGAKLLSVEPGPLHPPGLYGSDSFTFALNVTNKETRLKTFGSLPVGFLEGRYATKKERSLKARFLGFAFILLLLDGVLAMVLSGRLGGVLRSLPLSTQKAAAGLFLFAGCLFSIGLSVPVQAQDISADNFALNATLGTPLAYVITGNQETDEMSQAGLRGLSRVLARRTAMEPAPPMGVNIENDELAFFPLLYWPITPEQQPLSANALAKVDAYMKSGGTIFFDTQDHETTIPGLSQNAGNQILQNLLEGLDIPPLEPVPASHVLTKAFYLLQDFPGRWSGGRLWVEATSSAEGAAQRMSHDGVSAIIIGSNDYAAAWAVDVDGRPLAAIVPGGRRQRELARRFGVNLVMYVLTGNYKADQVHVPALLERLGQ